MKILCIADHVDPLVYSSNIAQRFSEVDLILSAGDLNLDYYGFIVSSLNKPLYFVFGNHNLKRLNYFRRSSVFDYSESDVFTNPGGTYIGGKVVHDRRNDLLIAGLGGSRRYNNGFNQYTEHEMLFLILKMIPKLLWNRICHKRYLDILLTHAPPRHIHDKEDLCHTGFRVFRWFLRRFRPKQMIHGHIHLYGNEPRPHSVYGETEIWNAYDHFVLDFER